MEICQYTIEIKKMARKSRYSKVEQAAFMAGMISRGLQNPDSKISESYERGAKEPAVRKKKSLF